MKPVCDTPSLLANAAMIAAAKRRAAQKLNPASSLHAQLHEHAGPDTRAGNGRRKTDMVPSGTNRVVPFRYGPDAPRLDTAFVAQMLGQMMPQREQDHAGVLTAYEETPSTAQAFDTRL